MFQLWLLFSRYFTPNFSSKKFWLLFFSFFLISKPFLSIYNCYFGVTNRQIGTFSFLSVSFPKQAVSFFNFSALWNRSDSDFPLSYYPFSIFFLFLFVFFFRKRVYFNRNTSCLAAFEGLNINNQYVVFNNINKIKYYVDVYIMYLAVINYLWNNDAAKAKWFPDCLIVLIRLNFRWIRDLSCSRKFSSVILKCETIWYIFCI